MINYAINEGCDKQTAYLSDIIWSDLKDSANTLKNIMISTTMKILFTFTFVKTGEKADC